MTTDRTSFRQALKVWIKIGFVSFGGPAGQIALMHRELVDERKWLSEKQYLHALNFCMLLPGPEAMQLATYAGWRLHGIAGGLAAGLSFVLPGAALVLLLAAIYASFGQVPLISALFYGLKAAVLAIVVQALLRLSQRALKGRGDWLIALGAFFALFVFNLPFPLVIATAGLIGFWRHRHLRNSSATASLPPLAGRTLRISIIWLVIWFAPVAAIWLATGGDHILVDLGLFFSKLAVVTFGGAYAVLAYMGQEAVETHNWLTAQQMIDGLALAETTPGPLILVTEFVGYLAGFRSSGLLGNPMMGLAAALLTLWVTFAPCFLWIFAGAPYIERLHDQPRLAGTLAAITAAVTGVIANLALWFALHVIFADNSRYEAGPVSMLVPDPAGLDFGAVTLAVIAGFALVKAKFSVLWTLAICAAGGLAWQLLLNL